MARTAEQATTGPGRSTVWWVTGALTAAGMLAALWFYVASGLLAPLWAVALLLLAWVGLAFLAVRVHRRRGAWSLLVPVAAAALWFAVISLGGALLGWTA